MRNGMGNSRGQRSMFQEMDSLILEAKRDYPGMALSLLKKKVSARV